MVCLIYQSAIPPRLCLALDGGGFFLLRSLAQPSFAKKKTACSVCPAAHMGLSTVWIMAASMLSAFDILKPLDEYGTPIDPMVEYDFGLTLYACVGFSAFKLCLLLTYGYIFNRKPKSFKCRFQPRHEGVEALIRSTINSDPSYCHDPLPSPLNPS